MKTKQAQITLFLLAGLVVIVVFILVLNLKYLSPSEIKVNKLQTDIIQDYVGNCLELTTKQAILILASQGGYIKIPNDVLMFKEANTNIIYLYDYNDYPGPYYDKLLDISDWELEISSFIEENLPYCINGFEQFKKQGYEIDFGSVKAETTIRDSDVIVRIKYPLNITTKTTTKHIDSFEAKIGVRLKKVRKQAISILNAIRFADEEGDKEPARAYCNRLKLTGEECPQHSINFIFSIQKTLDYSFDFYPPVTTIWVIKTRFKTREPLYFIFAAKHKRLDIK